MQGFGFTVFYIFLNVQLILCYVQKNVRYVLINHIIQKIIFILL
uniref:Uncharacterized protein n=1 Tax=Anguilla anguilla TaxID=7936 RepID=A0A0E9WJV8_ANGAN